MIYVAEFTTNHMGNLNLLRRMIGKAKWAGADYIKMQKKNVDTYYTAEKLNSEYWSPYGETYGDYRRIFEFDMRDWKLFDQWCREIDIPWFSTVQDVDSLYFLANEFDMPFIKVASSNAMNFKLLKEIDDVVGKDTPIVISVAGLLISDIEKIVDFLKERTLYLLHCVAEYPCPDKKVRLGNINELRKHFRKKQNVRIGYSGHEVGIRASVAASTYGAVMLERHFALSRRSFVHHIECSLTPNEFRDMKKMIDSGLCRARNFEEFNVSEFGMTDKERSFLVDNIYGSNYLKHESDFYNE